MYLKNARKHAKGLKMRARWGKDLGFHTHRVSSYWSKSKDDLKNDDLGRFSVERFRSPSSFQPPSDLPLRSCSGYDSVDDQSRSSWRKHTPGVTVASFRRSFLISSITTYVLEKKRVDEGFYRAAARFVFASLPRCQARFVVLSDFWDTLG